MIDAKMVLDSTSPAGERVATLLLFAPKYLDAEIEKHGRLATNSSSSRAMSFPATSRQMEPFIPHSFQKPAKEMSGKREVDRQTAIQLREELTNLYNSTVSTLMPYKTKVHKQHLNRYTDPWTMQTKVLTANWYSLEAFLLLRDNKLADYPAMQSLAEKVKKCMLESVSRKEALEHIPFVTEDEISEYDSFRKLADISAGRLAKVSFGMAGTEEFESANIAKERAERLILNGHTSCFEHQLRTYKSVTYNNFSKLSDELKRDRGFTHISRTHIYSGRTRGWVQYRNLLWKDW